MSNFQSKKVVFNMFHKEQITLSNEQKEIIEWLIRHQRHHHTTAYETWNFLFQERIGSHPDRCIAYYDGLSPKEKSDVELIIARYFSLKHSFGTQEIKMKNILYKEKL